MSNQPIDAIRFGADIGLSAAGQIQLREYTTTIKTTSWSGGRPGLGTAVNQTIAVVGYSGVHAKIRQVSKQEVMLSGGTLKDQDVVLGPICLPYQTTFGVTGGMSPSLFSPAPNGANEMFINIQGVNMPTGGANFKKIYDETDKNAVYRVYLRSTANVGQQ